MPLTIHASSFTTPSGALTTGFSIRYATVPSLGRAFNHVVNTAAARRNVDDWVGAGFHPRHCLPLLHSVIVVFGIGHRIWGKWRQTYAANLTAVNDALQTAHSLANAGRPRDAFAALKPVKGLGSITYASKMLRFFSQDCPVLDSRIMLDCGYAPKQYGAFASDCAAIATRCSAGTTPVDAEAALYTAIQLNNPGQRKKEWIRLRAVYPWLCLGPGATAI